MDTDAPASSMPIHVLVVDDHPAVRQGLGVFLNSEGIAVCAKGCGRMEALARVAEDRPDLLMVDLSLEEEQGLLLIRELCGRGLPSLVYSMYEEGQHVQSAFAAGALGYVTKREIHKVLAEAIFEVAAGRRYVSPRAAVALADHVADRTTDLPVD